MKTTKFYYTQKGLTIVEVLAALVILGIVFIGFMTIFPQMTLVNEKTETKLDTMNLAREEMAKLTSASYTEVDLLNLTNKFKSVLNVDENGNVNADPDKPYMVTKTSENTEYKEFKIENSKSEFTYFVHVYNSKELEGKFSLYKIVLQIYTGGSSPNSETYGYLEVA